MGFVSALYPGEVVIDETNAHIHCPDQDIVIAGDRKTRGKIPRDWTKRPLGCLAAAPKFDLPLIPRSEWADRIEEMEKTKTRLSDIAYQVDLKCCDQDSTSNCWANAPVYCLMLLRAVQGLPTVYLSPAFIATTLSRYGGGMGIDAVEVLAEKGAPPVDIYGANANRKSITAEVTEAASHFKLTEWWDIPDRNDDAVMTCLLNRIPVTVGLNYWSHEVSYIDPVKTGNGFGYRFRNSWGMDYGTDGYNILAHGKGTPDDAEAPRVALPSLK